MANYNVLMDKASADYVIVAHDDDIQYPDRVSRIMDTFLTQNVSMVTSNAICINASEVRAVPSISIGPNLSNTSRCQLSTAPWVCWVQPVAAKVSAVTRLSLASFRSGPSTSPDALMQICLLYTSPSPRDQRGSRMPSSA